MAHSQAISLSEVVVCCIVFCPPSFTYKPGMEKVIKKDLFCIVHRGEKQIYRKAAVVSF